MNKSTANKEKQQSTECLISSGGTVHWSIYQSGTQSIEFKQYRAGGSVELDCNEGYFNEKGRWVGKRVMMSLAKDDVKKLKDYLNSIEV